MAKTARSADWIKLAFRTQSPDFTVLSFGQDEGKSSGDGPNYFVIILQSLTVDGWVVIALCGVMFVISLLVMIVKGAGPVPGAQGQPGLPGAVPPRRCQPIPAPWTRKRPRKTRKLEDSDFLSAVVGKHDHFQGSPVYHVYHAGVQELKKRLGGRVRPSRSPPRPSNVLRARLDAAVVREGQKLNQNMVLLTIAISGGPFLGLLGTVVGVMITFAVIAATGDVNINSIAPGISGALLATVAGLAVAIPALFGYNYLLTQIKDLTADMRVFTDEFLAMIAERLADLQRERLSHEGRRRRQGLRRHQHHAHAGRGLCAAVDLHHHDHRHGAGHHRQPAQGQHHAGPGQAQDQGHLHHPGRHGVPGHLPGVHRRNWRPAWRNTRPPPRTCRWCSRPMPPSSTRRSSKCWMW